MVTATAARSLKKDNRPFLVRFLVFQKERMPILAMFVMASLAVGVIFNFSHASLRQYLVAAAIIVLYMVQIRTSDEKKDFEHDNKFHPNRPVQRGVITLDELKVLNLMAIAGQLALYASFLDMRIFLFGLLSQGYAFLTRKEFFVREWIRQHFFTYYFLHYIQLAILFTAIINIIKPEGVSYVYLVTFAMLNVVMSELGRKMYPVEDDTTDDTYSAQLGHKGSALTLSVIAIGVTWFVYYFITGHAQKIIFVVFPLLALGYVLNSAYHYATHPHRPEAKAVENAANLLLLVSMASVVLGA